MFSFGLFKKTVLADGVQPFVAFAFGDTAPNLISGWTGALAFTFQLYYDFSGYSDMAIGLARIFGVVFPANFNSPYKACSIIDFWRRWHITLSRFFAGLPLHSPWWKSDRAGAISKHTYRHDPGRPLAWGRLHFYPLGYSAWRLFSSKSCLDPGEASEGQGNSLGSKPRADANFPGSACKLGHSSSRHNRPSVGSAERNDWPRAEIGSWSSIGCGVGVKAAMCLAGIPTAFFWIVGLAALTFLCPNTQQIMRRYKPVLGEVRPPSRIGSGIEFEPNAFWAAIVGALFAISVSNIGQSSPFLYYQF